ncbi:MAG TPA: long-chain fatty acid--CoA ligase, partial [Alphaproteobacteria bacterium]|nr:long-chain fatty acid--CoA ligase [Alphaproteobacteria bacterium]
MLGLMQDRQLLVSGILEHAALNHGEREIVSAMTEGPMHRYNYIALAERSRRLANALSGLGVKPGQCVATLAWNTFRHVECWYAIAGMGAIAHTINPRLFPEQIIYIANHAEDQYIFTDLTFIDQLEAIADQLETVKGFVILTDRDHMPDTSLKNAICYEDLIAEESAAFRWPELDENTACGLCYTSGTTGNPKGVLYSHRSNVLHAMAATGADAMALRSVDNVMPVVPMFHANAWALAYAVPMVGGKLVLPGRHLDGESVYNMLEDEQINFTAAVPTVWLMLLQHMQANDLKLNYLKRVVIGGSAVPRSMIDTFENVYGVEVAHAWGMTEMSPLGTLCNFKAGMENLDKQARLDIKVKQGRVIYPVEIKITDDDGNELQRDGKAFGHLLVRGPTISKAYLKGEGGEILDRDGWFDTGDVATIDPLGFMQITDRSKDVIKSGGEWISSIDLENLAVGCPGVAEAAVIGIAHPKWDERPLLIIVRADGSNVTRDEILAYMDGKIAKWWMPDDIAFVDEIPHTATGKIQKT